MGKFLLNLTIETIGIIILATLVIGGLIGALVYYWTHPIR
jgi:hypothetical protein